MQNTNPHPEGAKNWTPTYVRSWRAQAIGTTTEKRTLAENVTSYFCYHSLITPSPLVCKMFTHLPGIKSVFDVWTNKKKMNISCLQQGWPNGESARLPSMWRGFDFLIQRHRYVEFTGSLLCY